MKIKKVLTRGLLVCLTGAVLASTPVALLDVNAASWKQNSTGWWWQEDDGRWPANQWKKIDGKWYYFNGAGYMTTGWQKIGGKWYYMNGSGSMLEGGWHWINGKCYYMYDSGAMAANTWIGQYYVDGSGAWIQSYQPAHWIQSGSRWWYRHSDGGYTRNAWEKINGKWYHFDGSGWMQTGWLKLGATWYYLEGSGSMATNQWVGDYYLTGSGAMATNQWVGNKWVDQNGKWDKSKKKEVPLKSIKFNKDKLTLTEGETYSLNIIYNPTNTTVKKNTEYNISNSSVISKKTGNNKGITLIAKKPGTATVTVKINGKTAKCTVIVKKKEVPLKAIKLDKSNLELAEGQSSQLKVSYNPTNTTADKKVTWSSSDESIATVKNGLVTAVSEGTSTITATVGNFSASCNIKVYQPIPLESISLSEENLNWDITRQGDIQLTVNYAPANTTVNKKVTWSSSDEDIVHIATSGQYKETALITGRKPGVVTITAKVGDKVTTCIINFTASLDHWYLSANELEMNVGDKEQIDTIFVPDYTTADKKVTWSSSDESIATVENGLVTAVSEGTATITATNTDGSTNTCNIYVSIPRIPAESLSIDKEYAIINVEQQETLTASYGPDNTTDTLSWVSSDESVATVDDGVVTAIASGCCTITASIGNLTASCNVNVPYYFGDQEFAHEVFDEINRVRVENGLHAYEWDERLCDTGGKIVAAYDVMTGTSSKDYANHAGQIGVGVAGDIDSAKEVVEAWLNSPMHRGTILDPAIYIQTGSVAVARKSLDKEKGLVRGTSIIFDQGASKEYLDTLDWSDPSLLNIMPEVDINQIDKYLAIFQ